MEGLFAKSVSTAEKCKSLQETAGPEDTLAILIQKLVVIFRNASFRRDAGRLANEMFGQLGAAGGHKNMARAEIPLDRIKANARKVTELENYVQNRLRRVGKI